MDKKIAPKMQPGCSMIRLYCVCVCVCGGGGWKGEESVEKPELLIFQNKYLNKGR